MPASLRPFLMFTGQAQSAIDFYRATFPDAKLLSIEHYGPGEHLPAGQVKLATLRLLDQELMLIDSPPAHAFTFTPSISLFVTVDREAEIDRLFAALSAPGQVMMPLGPYPFARKFAWVSDRFGVSWQLKLA